SRPLSLRGALPIFHGDLHRITGEFGIRDPLAFDGSSEELCVDEVATESEGDHRDDADQPRSESTQPETWPRGAFPRGAVALLQPVRRLRVGLRAAQRRASE